MSDVPSAYKGKLRERERKRRKEAPCTASRTHGLTPHPTPRTKITPHTMYILHLQRTYTYAGIEHRHNPLLLCVPHLPSPAYLLELTHHVRTRPGRRNQRSAVHVLACPRPPLPPAALLGAVAACGSCIFFDSAMRSSRFWIWSGVKVGRKPSIILSHVTTLLGFSWGGIVALHCGQVLLPCLSHWRMHSPQNVCPQLSECVKDIRSWQMLHSKSPV